MKAAIGSSRIPVFVAALIILLGISSKRTSATTRSGDHQSHDLAAQDSITQLLRESRASVADVAVSLCIGTPKCAYFFRISARLNNILEVSPSCLEI
jgi:hypothetical protein